MALAALGLWLGPGANDQILLGQLQRPRKFYPSALKVQSHHFPGENINML